MTQTDSLRKQLVEPGIIPMPGIFDSVSARLAEQAGFKAAFMSGFMAVSYTHLTLPTKA